MSDNHQPICDMRFRHIEEKIVDLKNSILEQKDIIKDITDVVKDVEDENDKLKELVKNLKEKEEKLEIIVNDLNNTAKTLTMISKFAKPLIFAILAGALASIPNGIEIIKLLAGMF